MGLRPFEDVDREGLDINQHGEWGVIIEAELDRSRRALENQ